MALAFRCRSLPNINSYLPPTGVSAAIRSTTHRSVWPAFRSGSAIRPWGRCCCAGGSRRPNRHSLGEHDTGIDIPLWCEPPIDRGRDAVECPGALCVLGTEAGGGP